MFTHRALVTLLVLSACTVPPDEPGPLGIVLHDDGVTYAGFGSSDLTPPILETFTDLNGDAYFDGCLDDPSGTLPGCAEPFLDTDGDGIFEPTWIGGFGPLRPALSVHDPVEARALVLSHDGSYVVLLALDLVGLGHVRIEGLRSLLAEEGLDPDRLIVASSHNHQGPDVVGLWGDPYDLGAGVSGIGLDYQETLVDRMATAVRAAAEAMVAVEVTMAAESTALAGPYWNGRQFGGKNPTPKMHGLIHDIRDPVVVSNQLFAARFAEPGGPTVATLLNWAGHPEVRGSGNEISSDYVHWLRMGVEGALGGGALFLPECLGGMQSALGGDVPAMHWDEVLGEGVAVFQTCDAASVADVADTACFGHSVGDSRIDVDGEAVPSWPEHESFAFAESLGLQLAAAAVDLLGGAPLVAELPIEVQRAPLYVPLDNEVFQLLINNGLFEAPADLSVTDGIRCPNYDPGNPLHPGCVPDSTWRVRLGPAEFLTAPGEIVPEVVWGFPSDPRWEGERTDFLQRGQDVVSGRDAAFFPQHPIGCDDVTFEACADRTSPIGDCDCLRMHQVPYRVSDLHPDGDAPPLRDLLRGEFRFAVSMTGDYLGYIVPRPDFNTAVTLLTDDGDHYEDTVSASPDFADLLIAAQRGLGP